MTTILGINAYHGDSSACLIRDGKLIAAAEEERFRRVKHWAGFPSEAIRYCLDEAEVKLSNLEHVAINQDSKANLWRRIRFILSKPPDLGMLMDRIKNKRERLRVREKLTISQKEPFKGEVHEIEHHFAHLSSAFHVSPFEEAISVSVDGFGDFASTAWGVGHGSELLVDEKVFFPHSLGVFYQAITQWLGFPHYGDEYKVMGFAPYGTNSYMNEMHKIVLLEDNGGFKLNLNYFRHHKEKVDYEWENDEPNVGQLFSDSIVDLLGPCRQSGEELTEYHKNLAHSAQKMYEEAFFHLLNVQHKRHGIDNLCLAGGCAMNSVANGKVYRKTPFKKVYIQSAAGDAGGAIGSAYSVWHKLSKNRSFVMDHAYWGPSFGNN